MNQLLTSTITASVLIVASVGAFAECGSRGLSATTAEAALDPMSTPSAYLDANWKLVSRLSDPSGVPARATPGIADDYFAANWRVTTGGDAQSKSALQQISKDYFDANWALNGYHR